MFELPTSVEVDGVEYHITEDGDFRMVLDCFNALNDPDLSDLERMVASAIIFFSDLNSIEDVNELPDGVYGKLIEGMNRFFNCGEDKLVGMNVQYKVIDWEEDSQLIASAVNRVYGKEIRAEKYVHWWTFMGYFMAIGESPLATIVNIRGKIAKGKPLEKYEQEFRRDNPQYFGWNPMTVQQMEADRLARSMWNSGED